MSEHRNYFRIAQHGHQDYPEGMIYESGAWMDAQDASTQGRTNHLTIPVANFVGYTPEPGAIVDLEKLVFYPDHQSGDWLTREVGMNLTTARDRTTGSKYAGVLPTAANWGRLKADGWRMIYDPNNRVIRMQVQRGADVFYLHYNGDIYDTDVSNWWSKRGLMLRVPATAYTTIAKLKAEIETLKERVKVVEDRVPARATRG